MSKKTTTVPYRRKREGKTDYKKRLALLKSGSHRLVVRKSVDNICAQILEYHPDGDKVIASAHSRELIGKGWKLSRKSVPAAYLTGLLLGKKAKEDGEIIADFGMHPSTPGSRLYAVVKGVLDAGIKVKVSEDKLPSEERIKGEHIVKFAKKIKENKESKQFSKYLKNNIDPEGIPKLFEDVKKKITG